MRLEGFVELKCSRGLVAGLPDLAQKSRIRFYAEGSIRQL